MADRQPPSPLIAPGASAEESAAIVAAIEAFTRASAPPAAAAGRHADPWLEAAILEGVLRDVDEDLPDPWIYT